MEEDAAWRYAVGHRDEEAWTWTETVVGTCMRVEAADAVVEAAGGMVEADDGMAEACIQVEAAEGVAGAVDDRHHMIEEAAVDGRAGTGHDNTGHREGDASWAVRERQGHCKWAARACM